MCVTENVERKLNGCLISFENLFGFHFNLPVVRSRRWVKVRIEFCLLGGKNEETAVQEPSTESLPFALVRIVFFSSHSSAAAVGVYWKITSCLSAIKLIPVAHLADFASRMGSADD